jgi:hypothetical protein
MWCDSRLVLRQSKVVPAHVASERTVSERALASTRTLDAQR